ncbi:MAG: hypothetical protein K0A89_05755 [ANME-2 cluster archaeon]|nr:hypothetical protein [ANME-2 cluster archaeon]
MKVLEYVIVTQEKINDAYMSIPRWKKTLLYSLISHSMILFGIIVVYTFANKDFKVQDSLIITGVYLGVLATTHSIMYLVFRNRLR